jgi:hypothetical protein
VSGGAGKVDLLASPSNHGDTDSQGCLCGSAEIMHRSSVADR